MVGKLLKEPVCRNGGYMLVLALQSLYKLTSLTHGRRSKAKSTFGTTRIEKRSQSLGSYGQGYQGAFYMVGDIDAARAKGEKILAEL